MSPIPMNAVVKVGFSESSDWKSRSASWYSPTSAVCWAISMRSAWVTVGVVAGRATSTGTDRTGTGAGAV